MTVTKSILPFHNIYFKTGQLWKYVKAKRVILQLKVYERGTFSVKVVYKG